VTIIKPPMPENAIKARTRLPQYGKIFSLSSLGAKSCQMNYLTRMIARSFSAFSSPRWFEHKAKE
jgi:hypothetical protein